MKTLIKQAVIVDGSRRKRFTGDILIVEDKIAEIGQIKEEQDMEIIDARGLVASPGFIDTHSHSDLQVLMDSKVLPKVMQGITTEVLGQDGISMAPLPLSYVEDWRKNLAGLDGDSDEIDWSYRDTKGYLQYIERCQPGINETYLVPHGNVRMEGMGLENREPTREELEQMKRIVAREMEAGALGLSTGLVYTPCSYARTEELIELCKVVAQYHGIFVTHQRSEADTILSSMDEIFQIGRESGVRIHFSHFKVCGKENFHQYDAVIEKLDQAKAEGLKVSFDQYPYITGSTMLGVVIPPWAHDGGTDEMLRRLHAPSARKKMIEDIKKGINGWDDFIKMFGFDKIIITSVMNAKNEGLIGMSLADLGRKKSKDPFEATFDLLIEEENAVGMYDYYGKEEHVAGFLKREEMNGCTDGLLGGKPHPRAFGAFPRILGKYVREECVLSLEEAIYKMSYKAALAMNIPYRGLIKEDWYADIVLFDPSIIQDQGTYVDPIQFPIGIEYVFVNGKTAVRHGTHTGYRNGKVIRRSEITNNR